MVRGRRYKAGLKGVAALRSRVRFDGLTFEEAGAECKPPYTRQSAHAAIRYFEQRFDLKPTDPNPQEVVGGSENDHLPPCEPRPADTGEGYRLGAAVSRTALA